MVEKIWLLTVEALDEVNNPITLRFSSGYYNDPLGNYYDDRIQQPALFTLGVYTGNVIQTGSRSGFGETVLVNLDGGLDYLADYAVDGRVSVLSLVDELGVVTPIIEGTVQQLVFSEREISVRLRDPQESFSEDHPANEYLGNNILPNGLEGVEGDIKGQVKPKVYGQVRNAEPKLVNTSQLIYQVHDLTITPLVSVSVLEVYDRGVMLTKHNHYTTLADFLAAGVPSGHYATYEGYFKLGSSPTGTVTCDVDSSKFLLGDVFELIVMEGGFTFDHSDKTSLNLLGSVGIYHIDNRTTASMLDLLSMSVGAYWYFEGNVVKAKQLVAPITTTSQIQDYEIVSISRDSLGSGENGLPVYKIKLKADKVETVQNDLAGAVDDVYRARVAVQFREAIAESMAVKTRHPLSKEIEVETALRSLTDAQVQANRIQTLLGVRRDTVRATVRLSQEQYDNIAIGRQITLFSYKYGYSSGKNFVVLGYTINAKLLRVELELWG